MNFPDFGRDKERLLHTLARFDGNISANDAPEDVIDGRNHNKISNRHYHTFFLHILLENVCNSIEPDDQKREILFKEVCKRLAETNFLNESLNLDSFQPVRKKVAEQFFNFVKQIHIKVIPDAGGDSISVRSFLDESNFAAEQELQYRYEQNFEELEVIAKGGFGLVCKAKHKVTELVYAVKKIVFKYKSDAEYLKVVREAKNIAALNHPNIVSYNNAWIECLPHSECELGELESSSSNSDSNSSSDSPDVPEESFFPHFKEFQTKHTKENQTQVASSVPGNWFEKSTLEESEALGKSFSFLTVNAQRRQRSASDSNVFNQNMDTLMNQWAPNCLNVRVMLCIQMEYCNCDLRLWLDRRAEGKQLPFELDVARIFQDILNGVVYIHSKNIIHRDLKPQNIFFSEASNVLKIGDFGLATLSSCASDVKRGKMSKKHSANLGTVPYAAPEQIKGPLYDSKVDVYSLGIILFELLNVFSTKMEFSKAISEILKGNFPRQMETNFPVHTSLVRNLVNRNPRDRMSAREILNQLQSLESPQAHEILSLRKSLSEKEDEIIRLKALVEEQQSIICRQNIDRQ